MGPEPGFHTQHKRFISKDRTLLKKLEEAVHRGGMAGTIPTLPERQRQRLTLESLSRNRGLYPFATTLHRPDNQATSTFKQTFPVSHSH